MHLVLTCTREQSATTALVFSVLQEIQLNGMADIMAWVSLIGVHIRTALGRCEV